MKREKEIKRLEEEEERIRRLEEERRDKTKQCKTSRWGMAEWSGCLTAGRQSWVQILSWHPQK
jgi:hypothetical protein